MDKCFVFYLVAGCSGQLLSILSLYMVSFAASILQTLAFVRHALIATFNINFVRMLNGWQLCHYVCRIYFPAGSVASCVFVFFYL